MPNAATHRSVKVTLIRATEAAIKIDLSSKNPPIPIAKASFHADKGVTTEAGIPSLANINIISSV
jgi:hypothetical protein